MRLVLPFLSALTLIAAGCAVRPVDADTGGIEIASDPPGASILVRDCPRCEDREVAKTPYRSSALASDLQRKYLHLALEGYAPSPIRFMHARSSAGKRIYHDFDPVAGGGYGTVSAAPVPVLAQPESASADEPPQELRIVSAQLQTRYRPTLSQERELYEPLSSDMQFLSVALRAPSGPTGEALSSDGGLAGDDAVWLLGPGEGKRRKPVLVHRRLAEDGLAIEYAFAVSRAETGPYAVWVKGVDYPLSTIASGERGTLD